MSENQPFKPCRTVGEAQIDVGSSVVSFEFYGTNTGKTITVRVADTPLRSKADFENAKYAYYHFVDQWLGYRTISIEQLKEGAYNI